MRFDDRANLERLELEDDVLDIFNLLRTIALQQQSNDNDAVQAHLERHEPKHWRNQPQHRLDEIEDLSVFSRQFGRHRGDSSVSNPMGHTKKREGAAAGDRSALPPTAQIFVLFGRLFGCNQR